MQVNKQPSDRKSKWCWRVQSISGYGYSIQILKKERILVACETVILNKTHAKLDLPTEWGKLLWKGNGNGRRIRKREFELSVIS